MVVADSSVWIDFFNGRVDAAVQALRRLLHEGDARIVVPDLVLFEVLRGFRDPRALRQAQQLMSTLDIEPTCDAALGVLAAQHYRDLRAAGHTVRSGIDVLVASFCIERGYTLLHRDRDFLAFEQLRGLRGWKY